MLRVWAGTALPPADPQDARPTAVGSRPGARRRLPPGPGSERNSVSAVGAKISGGVGASSRARSLPGRIRASVMCGRKRSRGGCQARHAAQLAAERAVQRGAACRRGRRPRPRARAGRRGGSQAGAPTASSSTAANASIWPASTRGDLRDRRRRLLAEEAQRQVQRLGCEPARAGAAPERPSRPVRKLAADVARAARPRRTAAAQPLTPRAASVTRRAAGGGAGASPWSRSARACRRASRAARVRRTIAMPSGPASAIHTRPTGFSGGAAAGPGDPGDADPDVGADALARPGGERHRHLFGNRPVAFDQLGRHASERRP